MNENLSEWPRCSFLKACAVERRLTADLAIDSRKIGSFTAEQLGTGINLATLETPMVEQARLVAYDTEKVNDLESARFGIINGSATDEQSVTAKALADAYLKGVDRQRTDAQPRTHHYDLVLVSAAPVVTNASPSIQVQKGR